jgi:hypothetical protein
MISSGKGIGDYAKKWRYLQILVVIQGEVDEYKRFGPETAVVFALPKGAEKMGIGCSRHFTKKLAERICLPSFPFCLMMDDSVHRWRGITLPDDNLEPFGEQSQSTPVR